MDHWRLRATPLVVAAVMLASQARAADSGNVAEIARLFGSLEQVSNARLSPDGKNVVVTAPGPGLSTYAIVVDVATRAPHLAARLDGKPLRMETCGWASNSRIACLQYGVAFDNDPPIPYTRTVAIDQDGKNPLHIGTRSNSDSVRLNQFDGRIIDWLEGEGAVLMMRDFIPTSSPADHVTDGGGIEVTRVDTRTGRAERVELPDRNVTEYISDGLGRVRIRGVDSKNDVGLLNGGTTYYYRLAKDRQWKTFSRWSPETNEFKPVAVDGTRDIAYAIKSFEGRHAIYSVTLDGAFKAELVASHRQVDMDEIITVGRRGHVIGTSYATDRPQADYFDLEYKRLQAALIKALPTTPLIRFVDASADEQRLLIYAGADTDPGHYFVYDKGSRHLNEVAQVRPNLGATALAPMKSVSFKAADGTMIPAYLTLPLESSGKSLPAIVMPHGGPDYRDEWGFDWLVQFFAKRGFAVLQPQFRGSTGYGDAFYARNAYRSWQTAMADIRDAGRWLVSEGVADPAKLAIVGWSYGGYAALQANVVEAGLFKAIVAVAPVTDLGRVKEDARGYTKSALVARQIGSGEIVSEGSPVRHADRITAPVLMFHGDRDINVLVAHSKMMDQALRKAGKSSSLVIFPGLDHQLAESNARTELLMKADQFLRNSLHM